MTQIPKEFQELRAEQISHEFHSRTRIFQKQDNNKVLDGMDLTIKRKTVVGLVGESGSGKTTLARIMCGMLKPTKGEVYLDTIPIHSTNKAERTVARQNIRFIFQNVNAPFNPRMKVWDTVEEPLLVHTELAVKERKERIEYVTHEVGLPVELLQKYPRTLSGGEKRRIGIARALVVRPHFLIADEPTAGLDADLRGDLLKLFTELRDKESLGI
ncbi:MAG: ATP-binding cassette domain-containing protein, partial [Bacteroidetes bacterium]